jgi:hypothetical protein
MFVKKRSIQKMKKIKYIIVAALIVFNGLTGFVKAAVKTHENNVARTFLEGRLMDLFPKAEISVQKNLDGFTESYQMILDEPLDHKHPEKGSFKHYIYLSHVDYNNPMILVTEGYAARYVKNELSTLLKANQVVVEYRFYGKSRPEPIPWDYLTCEQAIEDYHSISTKLKQLYTGKWISTGISKGGETTLIYKSKYPDDVAVAVPYVAPLISGKEDPRTNQHIATIGTEECRNKVTQFQRALLQQRNEVLIIMAEYAQKNNMKFTEVPMNEALEYAALEFPFSFWQWGGKCEEIPTEKATPKELFDYVNKIVSISFYNDDRYFELLPSFYQHMRELGYYGFDLTPVKDLLQVVKSSTNSRFAPKVPISYDPKCIQRTRKYAEKKGDNILYIYGGNDTWVSCAPTPEPTVDALKMVLPGGSHATRIKNFPPESQEKIMQTLKRWLFISPEKG